MSARDHDLFETVAENIQDCCAILAPVKDPSGALEDLRIEYVNPPACEVLGGPREALVGSSASVLRPEMDSTAWFGAFEEVMRTGERRGFRIRSPERVSDLSVSRCHDRLVVCWRDVTESVEREATSQEYERRLETIVEQSVDGLLVIDADGVVRFANRAARGMLGDGGDLTGFEIGTPAVDAPVEMQVPRGDETLTLELRASEIRWEGAIATLASLRNVTEDKRRAEALRDSEQRFRRLFEHSVDAILIADRHGRYQQVNPAACELFGYSREELLSMSVGDLRVPGSERAPTQRYREYVDTGTETGMFVFLRRDGARRIAEYGAFALAEDQFASVLRDVTDRRSFEARLEQSRKMEAIGELAGGVAHDFNNLLMGITSFTELVREELQDGDPRRDDLDEVLRAAERASELTHQLLAFSRQQPVAPARVDLNELLRGVRRLLVRTLGPDVEIVTREAEGLWAVVIDPGRLEQTILNLAVNARHAMPSGGRLIFETRNEPGGEDGDRVLLRVEDTGAGMTEEVRSRIFDPFFTTKAIGEGTGLGLSTVYGLVTQAGGVITVQSAPGAGTRFEIRLPRAADAEGVAPESTRPDDTTEGAETILVADDEPLVRRAVTRILRRAGYEVLEARDGAEAVELVRDPDLHIDLVLCDVVMPRMDGAAAAAAIAELRPGLKLAFISGHTENRLPSEALERGAALIHKPFTRERLLSLIHELLDG